MKFHPGLAGAVVAVALSAGALWGAQTPQQYGPAAPAVSAGQSVVVELFTSQGCSSCPPADVLIGKLSQQPNIVAITRPVTYWDQLGWKDTLAKPENTNLQRAYAKKGLRGAGVYTPQAVVQGANGAVGSDARTLNALIADAAAHVNASLDVSGSGASRRVKVNGGARPAGTLRIVALKSQAVVAINAGENGGRKVTYHNVLLSDRDIGRWTAKGQSFALPADATSVRGADRYALILQDGASGPILAARML